MNKKCAVVIIAFLSVMTASAQTLFTYGNYSASAADFLRAYNKNNSQPVTDKAKSMAAYLDLYINSRLKIREAYDRRYDTLPQILAEVMNLRSQIVENYMTDPDVVDRLKKEAFQRSQKDIHAGEIFISFRNRMGAIDTVAAELQKNNVVARLQKGEDFLKLAQEVSNDPGIKTNKGDLGYITVFTLPYELENAIYATPPGSYSAVIRSRAGYHIFKNLGERKAVGKIKAQQILLAIPPNADDAAEKKIAARADSLYKRILAGDNFNKLASAYSNDYVTGASGGLMPDIGVGQYDAVFENALWSLPKDGAVSKPFRTSYGWHILKRVSLKPVITNPDDKSNQQDIQDKLTADGRWKASRDVIYARVIKQAGFKQYPYDPAAMWAMSDSVLDLKPMTALGRTIIAGTPIFTIGDSTYNATAWVNYANVYRFKQDGTGAKPYEEVMEEFTHDAMFNYYRDHLEKFNPEFRTQMEEFKDGNIFFEIMQNEVWNRAQTDTLALMDLYNRNKKNYTWKQSADAVLFFCSDQNLAKTVYEQVKKNPADWRKVTDAYSEKVIPDSSRYEWTQIPNLNKVAPKNGMVTMPLVNSTDFTASFAYIIQTYPQPMQRSFNEARGLVINDYQVILEKQWEEILKKKYPVTVDQKVLESISK